MSGTFVTAHPEPGRRIRSPRLRVEPRSESLFDHELWCQLYRKWRATRAPIQITGEPDNERAELPTIL
jgi:hypothetical protein